VALYDVMHGLKTRLTRNIDTLLGELDTSYVALYDVMHGLKRAAWLWTKTEIKERQSYGKLDKEATHSNIDTLLGELDISYVALYDVMHS